MAKLIKETIAETFDLEGNQIMITASIGISMYPEHGTDLKSLLHNSDTAIETRGGIIFSFKLGLNEALRENLLLYC